MQLPLKPQEVSYYNVFTYAAVLQLPKCLLDRKVSPHCKNTTCQCKNTMLWWDFVFFLTVCVSFLSLALVLPDYSMHYIAAKIGDTITQAKCKWHLNQFILPFLFKLFHSGTFTLHLYTRKTNDPGWKMTANVPQWQYFAFHVRLRNTPASAYGSCPSLIVPHTLPQKQKSTPPLHALSLSL